VGENERGAHQTLPRCWLMAVARRRAPTMGSAAATHNQCSQGHRRTKKHTPPPQDPPAQHKSVASTTHPATAKHTTSICSGSSAAAADEEDRAVCASAKKALSTASKVSKSWFAYFWRNRIWPGTVRRVLSSPPTTPTSA
jgi:hypothetical protein